jgi:hypothetical protein
MRWRREQNTEQNHECENHAPRDLRELKPSDFQHVRHYLSSLDQCSVKESIVIVSRIHARQ